MEKLEEIENILKLEVAQRHSYFQLKYFLIGKEPTNQSKMWQCLRELKARKEALDNLNLEIENTKDNLELLEISSEQYIDGENREMNIKKRQNGRMIAATKDKLIQLEKRKQWTEEEMVFFLETFKSIQKIEPMKNFDDLDAQKEYWSEKLTQKLNLKMLTSNQIDTEIVETIIALPDDIPIKKQTLNTLMIRKEKMIKQLKEINDNN